MHVCFHLSSSVSAQERLARGASSLQHPEQHQVQVQARKQQPDPGYLPKVSDMHHTAEATGTTRNSYSGYDDIESPNSTCSTLR